MQTSTHRPATARTQTHKAPVYPDYAASSDPAFFLACLLREQAQYDALGTITGGHSFHRKPLQFRDVIYTSLGRCSNEIEKSLRYVISDGLLPFAHAHTTYFAKVAA